MSTSSGSVYSDIDPEFQCPERSESPSLESDYDSDEDMSPATPRTPSLYSYTSGDAPSMLKQADGRTFNNQSEVYFLPADEGEFDRLGLQHKIHTYVMGGLYPGADLVERVLAPEWGIEKAVLDVGTGPGHWAIAMARKYPHVDVVGIDLAPRTSFSDLPSNLRLEFDDANLGFPHYHNCFDVIHARSVSTGINDFGDFVKELERCLRPGGVLIVIDGEVPIRSATQEMLKPASDGEYPAMKGWMARIMHEAGENMKSRGGHVLTNCAKTIESALRGTGKLYPPVVHPMLIPLGPWPIGPTPEHTAWIQKLGDMMRTNAREFIQSLSPMLKSQGHSAETVARFISGAQHELTDLSVPMYTRWAYAYAQKPLYK